MGAPNNHPNVNGGQKLAALKAVGEFKEVESYDAQGAATQYAIDAAYDSLMLNPPPPPAEPPLAENTPPPSSDSTSPPQSEATGEGVGGVASENTIPNDDLSPRDAAAGGTL